jgi:hypothetical protein
MSENKAQKTTMKNLFTDKIFTVCFVAMLMIVLFGRKGMNGLAAIFGLGPGWPELLQGVTAFLLLLFLAGRAIQLGRRARQQ